MKPSARPRRPVRPRNAIIGVAGIATLVLVLFVAAVGPLLTSTGPFALSADPLQPPSASHPFGTDNLGRDVLTGILYGARTSLLVAFGATAVAFVVGCVVGAVAGYRGGLVDDLLMRLCDIFQAVPRLVLTLVIVALFGSDLVNLLLVLGLLSWPEVARILRGQFISLRERDYVAAVHSIGMKDTRIIFREILPNALPPTLVTTSLLLSSCIILEAGLAYLGLSDPNYISWGRMLNIAQPFLSQAPWLVVFPSIAIFVTSLGAALSADYLNDRLNPRRLRKRSRWSFARPARTD
ncbi:MAG: ABC transporter permease subunit [Kiloniellaceae bacterium]|nr:ABC transporter permease subunit [Kiloniellaceae bacterium]